MESPHRLRPESVEVMFHAHYATLVRSLTMVAGDRETAEDAVQEAFAQALIHWSRVSAYGDPVAWVRRVALNRLFNLRRKGQRRVSALLRHGSRLPEDPDESRQVTNHVDLDAALQALPMRQRSALSLFYLEDLSIDEIAHVLGVSEGTVKTHLHRARVALRSVLEVF
jgi:RNA polymerase sigma-70 factor (ECF subfamily)